MNARFPQRDRQQRVVQVAICDKTQRNDETLQASWPSGPTNRMHSWLSVFLGAEKVNTFRLKCRCHT